MLWVQRQRNSARGRRGSRATISTIPGPAKPADVSKANRYPARYEAAEGAKEPDAAGIASNAMGGPGRRTEAHVAVGK